MKSKWELYRPQHAKHRGAAAATDHGRVLDELSFEAPEKKGQSVTIDADYVRKMLTDIVKDLSRYIL